MSPLGTGSFQSPATLGNGIGFSDFGGRQRRLLGGAIVGTVLPSPESSN